MRFAETPLRGAYVVGLEERADERGFYARAFCVREFEAQGIDFRVAQSNISFSLLAGTLRGLHYQVPPHGEAKFIRCIRGGIYDVVVDLRPESPTYRMWSGTELSAANRKALYIPAGFAHGFQTLQDDTEILYDVSEFYAPHSERGFRHDDPAFGISWPLPISAISEKDRTWPDWHA